MNIVVLDGYAANPGDLCWDELQALGECTIYDRTAPAEVLERAAGAEILLTNKTVLTAEHMAALPELKYIGVLATGYNIVDTTAAKERGIIVTNIPAYSTDSVAQMVFAHILNITQQVQHHSEEVHRGRWTASKDFCFWDTPLIELREKKLGIVGLGHTGFTTARIAIGFGIGINAMIALYLGAGDRKKAETAATHGMALSLIHGILITIVSIAIMPGFLRRFTSDAGLIASGITYSTIVFLFATINMAGLAFEKMFQAVGRM